VYDDDGDDDYLATGYCIKRKKKSKKKYVSDSALPPASVRLSKLCVMKT